MVTERFVSRLLDRAITVLSVLFVVVGGCFMVRPGGIVRAQLDRAVEHRVVKKRIERNWTQLIQSQLRLDRDIIRVGYDGTLHVHLPCGRPLNGDLNPSYDLRVMLALALSTALHAPEMLGNVLRRRCGRREGVR